MTRPITKPVRSADPTFEPLTIAEARKQVGLGDVDYHDEHLNRLIKTAREQVEHDTGLVLATGTFTWKFTDWPCGDYFEIPLRPVTAIGSIAYIDSGGTSQTWSASEYVLETSTVQPVVRLAYNYSFPSLRGDINGITVTMTAGYATVLSIPQALKYLVLMRLKAEWLDLMEQDSEDQHKGYERQLMRFMRSTYP